MLCQVVSFFFFICSKISFRSNIMATSRSQLGLSCAYRVGLQFTVLRSFNVTFLKNDTPREIQGSQQEMNKTRTELSLKTILNMNISNLELNFTTHFRFSQLAETNAQIQGQFFPLAETTRPSKLSCPPRRVRRSIICLSLCLWQMIDLLAIEVSSNNLSIFHLYISSLSIKYFHLALNAG